MGTTLTIVLVGILLGTLQMVAGVLIGRCVPFGRHRRCAEYADPETLRDFLRRLSFLVHSMNNDVGQHRAEIGRANRQLAAAQNAQESSFTSAVLNTVTQVMEVNERLHNQLALAEEKLQEQKQQIELHVNEARTDPLTGLSNRRALEDEMARRLAEWQRHHKPFSLVLADIDRFKEINDRYGHPAGDQVLEQFSRLLQDTVRQMDFVARFGGEEFAIVLPGTDWEPAKRAAERVRLAVAAAAFQADGHPLRATMSVGLARIGEESDPTELVRRADQALLKSKRSGRNCGHFHNGRSCERIELDDPSTAEVAFHQPPDEKTEDSELNTLSLNLQSRLAEIASEA
jgi:diguanylate cyclase